MEIEEAMMPQGDEWIAGGLSVMGVAFLLALPFVFAAAYGDRDNNR